MASQCHKKFSEQYPSKINLGISGVITEIYSMDIIQKAIRKGKSEVQLMAVLIIVFCLAMTISELLIWQSTALLISQSVLSLGLVAITLGTLLGRPLRWVMFSGLLLVSMFSFYLSGSRMAAFKDGKAGFSVYLALAASLTYLMSALYLAYSTEIGLFLRWKKEQRDQAQV